MSIKVTFEIGHVASLKSKTTPEGFTHDWELFVRGCDSNDISHFIDKVVFNLHESFPKPKRVIKEPPYILKESGYAGFELPIDIYFKNEPKKVPYPYDLNLKINGTCTNIDKKNYTFKNPSDDFRRKLLKGGGVLFNTPVGNADDKSRESIDDRSQLISKPKLGGSDTGNKKYKSKLDESKVSNTFADLFGTPITKVSTKVSPDPKNKASPSTSNKQQLQKSEKVAKDKADKEKKDKNKHIIPIKDKVEAKDSKKNSDDKHDRREDKKKDKTHSKERERSKDKAVKRPPSPKPRSPKRLSPARSAPVISKNEDLVPATKVPPKHVDVDRPSSSAKKSKKEKKEKSHEKDREREKKDKEHKQKEERPLSKASDKIDSKKEKEGSNTPKDATKEKNKILEPKILIPEPVIEPPKVTVPIEKKSEKDPDRKHKHKKKDKNKDKDKDHGKDRKKEKISKSKEDVIVSMATMVKKNNQEAPQLPPPPAKLNPLNTLLDEIADKASSDSEEDHTTARKSEKPDIITENSNGSIPEVLLSKPPEDLTKLKFDKLEKPDKPEKPDKADKPEKPAKRGRKETKSVDKEEKKRKRKAKEETAPKRKTPSPAILEPPLKQAKKDEPVPRSNDSTSSISSYSTLISPLSTQIDAMSTKSSPSRTSYKTSPPRTSTVRSTSPRSTSLDYMSELKDLQHKIMTLQDNNELQQVVEMIAATGCYEITSKTFDFDLCALDQTTVQRLQDFFSASCS